MTFEQHKQERQALIDHLLAQEWNVFGTLFISYSLFCRVFLSR